MDEDAVVFENPGRPPTITQIDTARTFPRERSYFITVLSSDDETSVKTAKVTRIVCDNDRRQPISLFSNDDTPVTVGLVVGQPEARF